VRKVAIVASASGNGKTTLGRALAPRLDVPFVELDGLVHGPGWVETADDELRAQVAALVASEGWVIDGTYQRKLGDLVLRNADAVIWLDLPLRVALWRVLRRTLRRLALREELWHGNRESLRGAFWGPRSLVGYAIRTHMSRRHKWPRELRQYPVVRLRSQREVDRFLSEAKP
jgi:adenylate kinase family enzyme